MVRLLVVGGSGYLGSRIVRQALKAGHAVTSLSRRGRPTDTVTPASELAGAEWIAGDVTDSAAVASAVDKADAVITTLGVFGSNAYMRSINGDANIAIARAAKEAGGEQKKWTSWQRTVPPPTRAPDDRIFVRVQAFITISKPSLIVEPFLTL